MTEENLAAKVFISYSWTSDQHQKSVVQLAEQLMADGVEVVLDVWDLKKGHNLHKFMEAMVSSNTITKVLLIVDKEYQQKADNGTGGVGIETEIVSGEIYNNAQQEKFIPILWERDENNDPCLPVFLKSRIYIDMSQGNDRNEYQELLRTIYNQPLFVKPARGKAPAFLKQNVLTPAPASFYALRQSIKQGDIEKKPFLVKSFFNDVAEAVRVAKIENVPDDDQVVEKIQAFLPILNEFTPILYDLLQVQSGSVIQELRNLFESCLSSYALVGAGSSYHDQFAAIQFISQELLLHTTAVLLKLENFNLLDSFFSNRIIHHSNSGKKLVPLSELYELVEVLDKKRNQRLNLRRVSLTADLLKERVGNGPLSFDDLIQADIVIFLWSGLSLNFWYPRTVVYINEWHVPDVFVRGEVKAYFDKIAPALGVKDKNDLLEKWNRNKERLNNFRQGDWHTINMARVVNLEKLGTIL